MIELYIAAHPMEPEKLERLEVDNILAAIRERFPSWPGEARLYDLSQFPKEVSTETLTEAVMRGADITPRPESMREDVERLNETRGPVLLVLAPADPVTAIVAAVAVLVGIAATLFLMPSIPKFNEQYESPNNALSDRQNTARPGGRIPDIFGTVKSTPDLLTVPYKFFDNHLEIDLAYMCIGRGSYEVTDIRDGDTPIEQIAGSSAIVYGPGTSPNSGSPQLEVGVSISDPVYSVKRSNDVNGQTLRPPNSNFVKGDDNIRFVYPDIIQTSGGLIDFTDYFDNGDTLVVGSAAFASEGAAPALYALAKCTSTGTIVYSSEDPSAVFSSGDPITLNNATFAGEDGSGGIVYVDLSGSYTVSSADSTTITLTSPSTVNPEWAVVGDFVDDETPERYVSASTTGESSGLDLSGTYTILDVEANEITLSNPALVNGDWDSLDDLDGSASPNISPSLSTNGERWIGPFTVQLIEVDRLLANFVALQGLYKVSKKNKQFAISVSVLLEVTPVDEDGTPLDTAETFTISVEGSDDTKQARAASLWASLAYIGAPAVSIRARRTTPADLDYDGTIVDEIKWRDAYAMAEVYEPHFGDITTIHTRTYATASATSLKERKITAKVTRKLPERDSTGELTGISVASNNFDDIITAMATDPYIGRRSGVEVDVLQIRSVGQEVEDYFGDPAARGFGFTFDDDNLSFEESLAIVAEANFCKAYRSGSIIQIAFEDASDEAALLFNHRNILPGSQVSTVRFGVLDDQDGLELDYTSSDDGAKLTYLIPPNGSPLAARRVSPAGVSSTKLAYWQAWRNYNKMLYQNTTLEFSATQEAALVRPPDRIMVTDQTRAGSIEGEVLDQDGAHLLLSQPFEPEEGSSYFIFLNHIDATIESLPVEARSEGLSGIPEADRAYWVTVESEPRMALAIDPELFTRSKYEIVGSSDIRSRLFLLAEREPETNFTELVKAINYSFLYYMNDQLQLWLPAGLNGLLDRSAYNRHPVPSGTSPTLSSDAGVDQQVIVGAGAGNHLDTDLDLPDSFSLGFAVKTGAGIILEADDVTITLGSGNIEWEQGSSSDTAPLSTSSWVSVLLSYDAASNRARVTTTAGSIDLELVNHIGGPIKLLSGFTGRIFDIRIWPRALTRSEGIEICLSSNRRLTF